MKPQIITRDKAATYTTFSFRIRTDLKEQLLRTLKTKKVDRTKTFEQIVLILIDNLDKAEPKIQPDPEPSPEPEIKPFEPSPEMEFKLETQATPQLFTKQEVSNILSYNGLTPPPPRFEEAKNNLQEFTNLALGYKLNEQLDLSVSDFIDYIQTLFS